MYYAHGITDDFQSNNYDASQIRVLYGARTFSGYNYNRVSELKDLF